MPPGCLADVPAFLAATRHDEPMRRAAMALFGLFGLLALTATPAIATTADATTATGPPSVHTVAGTLAGSTALSSPSGIALDTAGDLFVADTNHCRVLLIPDHAGSLYGMSVVAHHTYVLAGSRCATRGALGYPTGVAVDRRGDVFIAEATSQRVQVVRPGGQHGHGHGPLLPVTVAGTGQAGDGGRGLPAQESELNEPTGVAVDAAGDLFIADTANCRVREVPSTTGLYFGLAMTAGHLYDVAGNGVCGSADRSGPAGLAQLSDPVAVAVDQFDDLYIADAGDQSVLEVPVHGGYYYDTVIGGNDMAAIVGTGIGNGPYLEDGLSATGPAAELNDPEGIAVSATGTLYITDGTMHAIRVVPRTTTTLFGRTMTGSDLYTLAGALPTTTTPSAAGDGTRWILTHLGVPVGIAVAPSGVVTFSDRADDQVRQIR
jgi:hypothetical protein